MPSKHIFSAHKVTPKKWGIHKEEEKEKSVRVKIMQEIAEWLKPNIKQQYQITDVITTESMSGNTVYILVYTWNKLC